ncbi:MAG: 4-hydroxythreonine-4-phosphate dehydrogenase PdxA [Clostridia bacterium]|nr:4-hydroxythreonine-4-phosphate dehydrogenase PdxA [Clostridia bacterium]
MQRPVIGIPMGDPAGIGPEIIVKSLLDKKLYEVCKPLVIGNYEVLAQAVRICGLDMKLNTIGKAEAGTYKAGTIDVIDLGNVDIKSLEIGKVQALGGSAAFEYIQKAVELASGKEVAAIATTPINKESLKAAKIDFIGHTEILAGLTNTNDPLTMFEVRGMRVFFLTRHVSLRNACDLITKPRLLDYIRRCTEALKRLGVEGGTMAVAGLNPHSGEHGLFGDEEVKEIEPAVIEAQKKGYRVVGPIGADSVFHMALQGKFNSVLSLYHDQGHIATKTLDFERTIAITIGLPFLRTSVDHGTAFDIAGTGLASPVSMTEAILLAAKYSQGYNLSSSEGI